jgi:hypothetical protein
MPQSSGTFVYEASLSNPYAISVETYKQQRVPLDNCLPRYLCGAIVAGYHTSFCFRQKINDEFDYA